MKNNDFAIGRRSLVKAGLATVTAVAGYPRFASLQAVNDSVIRKVIPSSGETIPVMGLGTSRTFDVAERDAQLKLLPVLEGFFSNGGALIDSSPMYGAAEATVGVLLDGLGRSAPLFSATKVWTDGRQAGIDQMQESMRLWGVKAFDLMQIHNLMDWQTHLPTLREWKAEGRIRYLGITTSHNRFHEELAVLMRSESLDFVQFSYNIEDRVAENDLLPIALDRGIAVLINRPFQRGELFSRVRGKALPAWAGELGINSWGQYFLKFIISHPAVTCVIPATSKASHMLDNMQAGKGSLPDVATRQRMIDTLKSI